VKGERIDRRRSDEHGGKAPPQGGLLPQMRPYADMYSVPRSPADSRSIPRGSRAGGCARSRALPRGRCCEDLRLLCAALGHALNSPFFDSHFTLIPGPEARPPAARILTQLCAGAGDPHTWAARALYPGCDNTCAVITRGVWDRPAAPARLCPGAAHGGPAPAPVSPYKARVYTAPR